MLATRTLLSKQTLAVLSRQPACFVHHGDYGNWGNTNIAVVSVYQFNTVQDEIIDKLRVFTLLWFCGCVPGFLRMWMVGWDWCPRGSIVSITPVELSTGLFHYCEEIVTWHLCPQHHVPPEPQRCSLPDVRSKSAANACDGPHEKAAGHRGEPVGLPANTDAFSDASQTGPVLNYFIFTLPTWLTPHDSIYDYFWPLHRNMMMEAARFSHGQGMMQMQDLAKLDVNSFDAVIFPGGHGVVKNLWGIMKTDVITSNESKMRVNTSWHGVDGALILLHNSQLCRSSFVKDGKDCKLHNDVERVLKEFHRSRKPIGYVSFRRHSVIVFWLCNHSKFILNPDMRQNCKVPLVCIHTHTHTL